VDSPEDCPSTRRTCDGVRIARALLGCRRGSARWAAPVNNVVDVGNYVMLERASRSTRLTRERSAAGASSCAGPSPADDQDLTGKCARCRANPCDRRRLEGLVVAASWAERLGVDESTSSIVLESDLQGRHDTLDLALLGLSTILVSTSAGSIPIRPSRPPGGRSISSSRLPAARRSGRSASRGRRPLERS